MLNMIKMDWFAIKYYQKRVLVICIPLFAIGYISPVLLMPTAAFFFFLFSLDPFAVEEKGDLNRLYLSLPVKRNDIVAGRYVLSLIMVLCGILFGLVCMPLANRISLSKWYPDLKWILALAAFGLLLYALMNLFMYPLLFKLGYQKGKFWGMYVPLGVCTMAYAAFLTYTLLPGNEKLVLHMLVYASEHMLLVSGGMLVLAAALLTVSYLLSLRIYLKREF